MVLISAGCKGYAEIVPFATFDVRHLALTPNIHSNVLARVTWFLSNDVTCSSEGRDALAATERMALHP